MAQDVRNGSTRTCHHKSLKESSLVQWLRLLLIPKFGPAKLATILDNTSLLATEILDLTPSELRSLAFDQHQINAIKRPDWQLIETQLKWLQDDKMHFALPMQNPCYPTLLKQISRPPLVIFGCGNINLLNSPQIAIVGSRSPTQAGQTICFELAQDISKLGFCVTSGLALGIDTTAHRGALSGAGKTLAVLGSGLNSVYPHRNKPLAKEITDASGLLISEFLVDTKPKAENFPRRNRIVSGLSLGVLVVEAAIKSGSLITAKYALEQDREVFAVPGSPLNPLSAGCHHLIKQGAKLAETCSDILEEFQNVSSYALGNTTRKLQKSPCQSLATAELLDSVDYDVTALDVIIQRSNLPIKEVLAQLLQYELRGLVATVSGGYIKLRGK